MKSIKRVNVKKNKFLEVFTLHCVEFAPLPQRSQQNKEKGYLNLIWFLFQSLSKLFQKRKILSPLFFLSLWYLTIPQIGYLTLLRPGGLLGQNFFAHGWVTHSKTFQIIKFNDLFIETHLFGRLTPTLPGRIRVYVIPNM